MYPWIVGPLVASGDFMQFVRHCSPVGSLFEITSRVVDDRGVPLLIVVLAAVVALGVLVVSRVGPRSASRPLHRLEPRPAKLREEECAR